MAYDYKYHDPERIFTQNIKRFFEEEFEKAFAERSDTYGIL